MQKNTPNGGKKGDLEHVEGDPHDREDGLAEQMPRLGPVAKPTPSKTADHREGVHNGEEGLSIRHHVRVTVAGS